MQLLLLADINFIFSPQYYEEDLRRLGSPVPVTAGSSARKEGKEKASSARIKLKRSQPKEEHEEEEVEDEEEDEVEEENEEEKKQTKKPRNSPVIENQGEMKERRISEDKDEGDEGEYIEDLGNFEFAATENRESQFESPEDEPVRKSSRTPGPGGKDDSTPRKASVKKRGRPSRADLALREQERQETLARGEPDSKPKKSEEKERDRTPNRTKKITEKNPDDVEESVRKSKRELKSPKKFSPEEIPKKKKPPKKQEEEEEEDEEDDDVYIIEALIDKKDGKYLVKWLNYPSEENTWEPKSAIPRFILKFYEQDSSRLGMPAPDVS